jgi:hypothetical protein
MGAEGERSQCREDMTYMSARTWAEAVEEGVAWRQHTLSTHRTESNAIEAARWEAKRDQVDLVTHGRTERIRSNDSFGSDPLPPRDRGTELGTALTIAHQAFGRRMALQEHTSALKLG